MRRPALEKGRDAAAAPLVLGRRIGRVPYQNLVAEPMEAPRTSTTLCVCRTLLTAIVTLLLTFAGFELLLMDNGATLVGETTTIDSWKTTSTADDDMYGSLVTTDEPNAKAAMNFKLSVTLDVTI